MDRCTPHGRKGLAVKYVDTHTHAISPDVAKYPLSPVGGHQSSWSRERPVTVEQLLLAMDEAAIDQAVLVHAATVYGYDNSYAADSLAGNESRLVGVCSIDFLSGRAVDDLEYWIDQRGFSGVRLKGAKVSALLAIFDSPVARPVWASLQDRQIPVCISLEPEGVAHVRDLLVRYPRLRLLADHAGNPDVTGGAPFPRAAEFFRLSDFEGVYLKLTTVTLERIAAAGVDVSSVVRALIGNFGADRLMWGTNFPATAGILAELVDRAQAVFAEFSADEQQAIFSRTAESVYPALVAHAPTQ
jgi:predicted TIM-barrel fold metal-dependent hydrolase